jgi:hypothetical protein
MRKIIALIVSLLTAELLFAEDHTIVVVQPFSSTAMLVNSTNYSAALDLNAYKPVDFKFALQTQATNLYSTNVCGIVALSYELSNNNVDYLSSSNIATELSFTNSPTTGGKGFYQFDTGKARYIRFKTIVTQSNCWFSGWLAVQ